MFLGMMLVTYLPRYIPVALLSRLEIPEIVIQWLKFIPPAILAALLAPGVLMIDGKIVLNIKNIFLLASLPTFLVAIYKKNIFLTILVGMISAIVLEIIIKG